jgi:hypothetical protein
MGTHQGMTTFAIGGDLPVRRLGFGAMRLTGLPALLDRRAGAAVAQRAVELGVNLIDTADSYDFGDNESLLAERSIPTRRTLSSPPRRGTSTSAKTGSRSDGRNTSASRRNSACADSSWSR